MSRALKGNDPYILMLRVEDDKGGGGWVMIPQPRKDLDPLVEAFRDLVAPCRIVRSVVIDNTDEAMTGWAAQSAKSRKEFDLS